MTNSVDVAAYFGRQHSHILRALDGLTERQSNFGPLFVEVVREVLNGNGAIQRYRTDDMTRDGFTLLVMGFTET